MLGSLEPDATEAVDRGKVRTKRKRAGEEPEEASEVDNSDPGPASPSEAFQMSDYYMKALQFKGLQFFGVDFFQHLTANKKHWQFTMDNGGAGTAEVGVRNIWTSASHKVAQEARPADSCGLTVDVLRTGDLLPSCRHVLLNHDGKSAANCVLGDAMARCPPGLRSRMERALQKANERASASIDKGTPAHQVLQEVGCRHMRKARVQLLQTILCLA